MGPANMVSNDQRRSPIGMGSYRFFVVVVLISLFVVYLNRHHLEQQTNFWNQYVPMAEYLRGVADRELLTYPMWGYPVLLLLAPSYNLAWIPQVLLGALAATLLYRQLLDDLPEHGTLLTVFFVGAVPWYLLHSVKWPQSVAASLIILGLVLLNKSFRTNRIGLGALAGLLIGVSFYFRAEFTIFPVALVAVAALTRLIRSARSTPMKPILACAAVSWLVLVPWAAHYRSETGRISITSSQGGIVAFISLGQLPNNPWGLDYRDEDAFTYLQERGIEAPAQSDTANQILIDEFKRRVREHPGAFAMKMGWNAATTLVGGFYSGEPHLSADDRAALASMKTKVNPFSAFRSSRVTEGIAAPRPGPRVYYAFGYGMLAKAVGSIFIIVSMVGMALVIVRKLWSPLLVLLGTYILYQGLLLVVLATEPRYLNGLYLAMVPFVLMAGPYMAAWFRRLRARVKSVQRDTASAGAR